MMPPAYHYSAQRVGWRERGAGVGHTGAGTAGSGCARFWASAGMVAGRRILQDKIRKSDTRNENFNNHVILKIFFKSRFYITRLKGCDITNQPQMHRSNIIVGILLSGVIAIGATTGAASAQSDGTPEEVPDGIPEEVLVGGVFDVSGNWSLEGEEAKAAAELAIEDFNEYLAAIGADWTMKMLVEDSRANSSEAFEKIQSLRSRGANFFLGVGFSSHIQTAKSYIEKNNLLIISHASQAADLAIDDSVFRLRPDDSNQAPDVINMLKDAGIEVLATVHRADTWGDGLTGGVAELFDGEVVELFKYDPDTKDFSVEVSVLDEEIARLVEEHGADKVGVLYVGTNEFLLMIQQMSLYENIDNVRWFSTNTQARNSDLVSDPQAFAFAQATQFTTTSSIPESNSIKEYVDAWAFDRSNRTTASPYTYPSYDSVWLLGVAIQQAQTTDVDTLTEVIPLVSRNMIGAVGHLELNEAGDLDGGSYEVWHVTEDGWVKADDSDAPSGS